MDRKRNTSNRLGTLALVCLVNLLTACNDPLDNDNGTGALTSVAEDSTNNNSSGENSQVPPADTGSPSPEDTSGTEPFVIALSWQPTQGQIVGYIVHTGPTPETATSVITVTQSTSVEYETASDLGLNVGDQSCFRIKAYNSEGQSGFSDAVCYTINS